MNVWAVTMVKDEADILPFTLEHFWAQGVNGILVADNGSTDGTGDLARKLGATVIQDDEVGYYQGQKMTALARMAGAQFQAEWIIPFDADELWYSVDGIPLAEYLRQQAGNVGWARLINHFCTGQDEINSNPYRRMTWKMKAAAQLGKACYRFREDWVLLQGNHLVADSELNPRKADVGGLEIRHFPYRSAEQFVRKARNGGRAYKATDLPDSMGAHWRMYYKMVEAGGDQAGWDWFGKNFFYPDPVMGGLVRDPAPWQAWKKEIA